MYVPTPPPPPRRRSPARSCHSPLSHSQPQPPLGKHDDYRSCQHITLSDLVITRCSTIGSVGLGRGSSSDSASHFLRRRRLRRDRDLSPPYRPLSCRRRRRRRQAGRPVIGHLDHPLPISSLSGWSGVALQEGQGLRRFREV